MNPVTENNNLSQLINKLNELIPRLDLLLPPPSLPPDWRALAFKWRSVGYGGVLTTLPRPYTFPLAQLVNITSQIKKIVRNTEQFLDGKTANNVLLSGARGTGKSSLIKSLLHEYNGRGLRLVEVDKNDLTSLPALLNILQERPEKFIIFCDDLSFDLGETDYKALKTALDGGLNIKAANVLVYATSNRRHLLPDLMTDNVEANSRTQEVHPQETIDEKTALSERFGLWLSFYSFSQSEYLKAVENWLHALGITYDDNARAAAILWARTRGGSSGRTAWQFTCDWAGRAPGERQPD